MRKLLRVDLSAWKTSLVPMSPEYSGLGGRALTSRLVKDEVPPACDPLGRHNKLVIAPGLLAGTPLSSSGRISVGAKSPLTGGIKESNAGGVTAQKLARLGIGAVVVEGEAKKKPCLLFISAHEVSLIHAPELAGMGNYALARALRERYGQHVGIISTGPAGEMGLAAAGIAHTDRDGNPSRFSGRGGLGAVMGVKGLKAIVIDDKEAPRNELIKDRKTFLAVAKELHKAMAENPIIQSYTTYGTAGILSLVNELGGLPTRNFSRGSFEKAASLAGETIHRIILERGGEGNPTHACMAGCMIRCSNVYPRPDGKTLVSPLEYETLGLLGSNCGIGDPDVVARLNWLCNDLGLDTIETGAALGVAMEAGLVPFGDGEGAERLIKEIAGGTLLGRVLGGGAVLAGRVLGVRRVPAVRGQAMPAYDPRAIKGNGVTYSTSPMGADHTAGNLIRAKDPHSSEGKVALSFNAQVLMAVYDSLGLCVFTGPVLNNRLELVKKLVEAKEGIELPDDYFQSLGRQVLQTEWAFNLAAGFTFAENRLPEYMYEEPLPPHNLTFDLQPQEVSKALKEFLCLEL